jgi:uncharacterized protein (TIRG00374 family)
MNGTPYSILSGRFFVFLGLGLAVYLGLSFYGDWRAVIEAFSGFSLRTLPLVLFLAFMNYVTRFWRWELYLKKVEIILPRKESFFIFMSGLLMTVTPGKMGELLKSYLLKERYGISMARSGPVVLAERITDLVAVYLLVLLGGISFAYGAGILWAGLVVLCLSIFPFVSPAIFHFFLNWLTKIPLGKRLEGRFKEAFYALHDLLGLRLLLWASFLGMAAWFFECLAFGVVFYGLGIEVPLIKATFIYAFATLAGALSMLPGGIGAAEGSMTTLLLMMQIPKAQASTATIIIRACTIWFAVLLGYIFLKRYQSFIKVRR